MRDSHHDQRLTLSREDLYELVWSKPIRHLAEDFGISDVALAKRCKRLRIPVPGRGYWARVDAGQTPHRPKLPEREEQYSDRNALTVPAPRRGATSDEADGEPLSALEDREVPAVQEGEDIRFRTSSLTTSPAPSILHTLTVIKRTAWHLKHPRRACHFSA